MNRCGYVLLVALLGAMSVHAQYEAALRELGEDATMHSDDGGTSWFASLQRTFIPKAVPSDVKFIKCAFCKEMVKEVVARAAEVRQKTKPLRADEDDYGAALEDICELGIIGKASWLRKLDIVDEEDGTLGLKRYDVEGTCRNNCHTCALTCKRHFNEYDIELASLLYEGASAAKIEKALCHRLTGACKEPIPKPPPSRTKDEAFKPVEEYEIQMEQHMKYLDFAGKNERQRTVPPTTNTGPTEKKGPQMTPQTENPLVNALIQDKVERFQNQPNGEPHEQAHDEL